MSSAYIARAACALMLAAGAADAATVNVEFSGALFGDTLEGSFSWDPTVPGASPDPTAVRLTDPGIMNLTLTFAVGATTGTITGVMIAGGLDGTLDLTPVAASNDIVSGLICLEASGGDGSCDTSNPADIVSFATGGDIGFSPASSANSGAVSPTYTVTEAGGPAPVPLPASLPLLLGALVVARLIAARRAAA